MPPPPADSKPLEEMRKHILSQMESALSESDIAIERGELTVSARPDKTPPLLKFLRDDPSCAFTVLIDLCGVDYPQREKRFDLVYHLLSMTRNLRVRVKTALAEDEEQPSVASIFPAAGWYEREAFDLYGIRFAGSADLRRILTDYDFQGHPLRKDFPLTGFVEVRYDDAAKKVVYEPARLAQEYRVFDFESPWEGMARPDRPSLAAKGQDETGSSK